MCRDRMWGGAGVSAAFDRFRALYVSWLTCSIYHVHGRNAVHTATDFAYIVLLLEQ